ncbi:target of Nesh-SH3 isoform X2 [Plectropomus leopardus]|uniref:target of Nesh-SH3 isoform X2 n=1 Tax=Plectropomus leopardus TaxID=160734 RepID=UPI001C4C6F58|nr:target of Nesh-SH3 isoform X2 [Plectropomus leopardus]
MRMGMQRRSHSFLALLLVVFIAGIVLSGPSSPRRSRVRRQNMKVRINATGDTIVLKFLRPNADTKLEGYILGYGSSMFSKQFIQLPENGQPYETEFDAEPKYLIAVQPIPTNEVKKQCSGKVELQKPLHLVIGSVTPTSVLLSWGTLLKTPYEGNVMNDCLEDGHYTVRYRERNRKWNYQTCPTSDTVIDNLKPNTLYEFGVQPNSKDGTGVWSKPVIHNISSGGIEEKTVRKILKRPTGPLKPIPSGPHSFPYSPRHVLHNRTQGRPPLSRNIAPKTTLGGGDRSRSVLTPFMEPPIAPKHPPPPCITTTTASVLVTQPHAQPQPNPQLQPQYLPPQQPKPQTKKPQPQPQPKPFFRPQPQPKSQPKPQPQPQPKPQPQPQPTSQPLFQTQPQPQLTSKPVFQTKPQPETTSKPIYKTKPQPRTTSKPLFQTQPQPQLTSKPVFQTKPQPETTSKPTYKTKPQPETTSKPTYKTKPQPETTSKPIFQTEPQPQLTSKPVFQTKPQPETTSKPIFQTKPQPQTTFKPVFRTKLQPQTTSKPVFQTKPQPQTTSKPMFGTKPQPQTTSKPVFRTKLQPQTTSKPIFQTQPQPQPTSKPKFQTQPQPQLTSKPIFQTKPQPTSQPKIPTQPQSTPKLKIQTPPQSQTWSKPHSQSQPQTTTQLQAEPQPQPTLQPKHQAQTQTQPHPKTQSQSHLQTPPQPTPVAHPQTPQPTLHHIPQTQQVLPKIHIGPQPQPQIRSTTQPQAQTQPQPKTNTQPKPQFQSTTQLQTQTQPQPKTIPQPQPQLPPKTNPEPQLTTKQLAKAQPTPEPEIFFQPESKTQPQPKSQPKPKTRPQPKSQAKPKTQPQPKPKTLLPPKRQPKPQPPFQPKKQPKPQQPPQPKKQHQQKPRTRDQQETHPKTQAQPELNSQSIPQPQPSQNAQTQSPLALLPKPQPQPGLQPQTRTYSDPPKVTLRQAVSTAPSPPEEGKPLPRPALATEKAGSYNQGTGVLRPSVPEAPRSPISSSVTPVGRNTTLPRTRVPPHTTRNSGRPISPSKTFTSQSSSTPGADGAHHRGNALPKPVVWSKEKPVPAVLRPANPANKRLNLVGKPSDHDKPMDLKQGDKESILKPFPLVTAKPKQERRQQQTTTSAPAVNTSRFDINENSSIFRPVPASEVDIMGKKRFVAPHVVYKTDKKPDEPCSITTSLTYFPDEEGSDQNVTGPPRVPPSNLTVVTVEGCPSFVILDWQKSDNETREYEVVSTTKGPNGEEVSVLTTNQTHTAVENLKPESSYEFTVTPKNELGAGPSTDPVSFSTESADPRVSEHVSGKDAIWTQFPFKSDDYSECNGKQYVKRTWYRKFVGIQLCNSLRYKIYLSDSLNGKFYNIGDQTGHGEDHCQFVDSFLDGRTGTQMLADQLPSRPGFYRALRQEPVHFGEIGGKSHVTYVGWYECGTPIPGKW